MSNDYNQRIWNHKYNRKNFILLKGFPCSIHEASYIKKNKFKTTLARGPNGSHSDYLANGPTIFTILPRMGQMGP